MNNAIQRAEPTTNGTGSSLTPTLQDTLTLGKVFAQSGYFADAREAAQCVTKRFISKIQVTDTCWLWSAGLLRNGYGQFAISHREGVLAHRFAYQCAYGPIPAGMCVLHRCDVRRCVRPDHLFLGTKAENNTDRSRKGRNASGEKNGSKTRPDRIARGERHWSKIHPEAVVKGECIGNSRLTAEKVKAIRDAYSVGGVTHQQLAKDFSVSASTIGNVINRRFWRHVNG